MDECALKKVRRKHSSWIRYLNTKDGQAYQEYIQTRNEAQHAVRRARRRFEQSIAKECKKNNKVVWNYVNSRRKSRAGITQLIKRDRSFTQTDKETAEVLSDQFYDTFTQENLEDIPTIDDKPLITDLLSSYTVRKEDI